MEKYKNILRYHFVGLSQRQTAEIVRVSRNTVSKVVNAISNNLIQVFSKNKQDYLNEINNEGNQIEKLNDVNHTPDHDRN